MTLRVTLCGVAVAVLGACSAQPDRPRPTAPLYTNLGTHHHPITTSSAEAQKYFDQGFTLSYAFNHAEAIRAFQQAEALDPSCAMCAWGVAFALGPNINAPITEEAASQAFQAIEEARKRAIRPGSGQAGSAPERERAYIEALAKRYAADPRAERAPLDAAYAAAMRDVSTRFPDDLDAATLFAQSLMDTAPWNYWNIDGTPRAFTPEVLASLERVLSRKPDHIGAIHLYIHAVEASPNPGRAEPYADTLAALVPGAGHLVHMPAHVYLRVGRYADASAANQDAMKADQAYFAGNAVPGNMTYQIGYEPHNIHFFATSASMEGRAADALKAADEVRSRMHTDMFREPMMGGMVQHMHMTPLFVKLRFAKWPAILAEPAPPADLPYMNAMWHAMRGLAHAAEGHLGDAKQELRAVDAVKGDPSLKTMPVSVNVAEPVVMLASEILAGEIAAGERRGDEASRHFAAAVAIEDGLTYTEPPDWLVPARQLQGDAMLGLGRTKEAESAFRGDMRKFPDNGWALSGLAAALARQGRTKEAADVQTRLKEKWAKADADVIAARRQ